MNKTQLSIRKATQSLRQLPNACEEPVGVALRLYARRIEKRHFDFDAPTRYRYKPNKPKYEARKLKAVGRKPQLVYSGRLKREVATRWQVYKRLNRYVLRFRYPTYGKYQRLAGRDFISPNADDVKRMKRYTVRRINQRRKMAKSRR